MTNKNVKTLLECVFARGLNSLIKESFVEKMTDRTYTVLATIPVSGVFVSPNGITKLYHDNGEQVTSDLRYHEKDISF